ncbi:nitroreductase [Chloroflexota bacterium]
MDLIEGIETRRSCRAYKPAPVPEEIIRKILETAKWSPSFSDSQPWEVAVVSGAKKDELVEMLSGLSEAGTRPHLEIPTPKEWPTEADERMKEHHAHHSAYLNIEQGGEEQRPRRRKPDFYGAPCAVFLFMDKTMTEWSVFDIGLFCQSLILAAHSYGVGSCLQAMMVLYPDEIKKFLGIPDTKKLVLGISLGYPDTESREYGYKSERMELDDFVAWHSE